MSRRNRFSGGYFTFPAFVIVLLMAVLTSALAGFQILSLRMENRLNKERAADAFESATDEMIKVLLADDSPDGDSPHDGFWQGWHETSYQGLEITVTELSGLHNINAVDPRIVVDTDLGRYVSAGKTTRDFVDFRAKTGLTLEPDDYKDFFNGDHWKEFFTVYGYGNINTIPADALVLLFDEREVGDQYVGTIVTRRKENPYTRDSYGDLEAVSGKMFPLLGLAPTYNVNFMNEKVLENVLEFLWLDREDTVKGWTSYKSSILTGRLGRELTTGDLERIFGTAEEMKPVYRYLGVKTWFWQIDMKGDGRSKRVIVARRPGWLAGSGDSFQIIGVADTTGE